jgi:hypothetical protein
VLLSPVAFPGVYDFCYTGGRLWIPALVAGPQGGNIHAAEEFEETDDITCRSLIHANVTELVRSYSRTSP